MSGLRSRPPASLYVAGPFAPGLYAALQLSGSVVRPVTRYECRPDRHARRRAFVAGGVPVDSCRRADGPVRHPPGDLVICLDGDRLGAGFPIAAVVLAAGSANRQRWRAPASALFGAWLCRSHCRGRPRCRQLRARVAFRFGASGFALIDALPRFPDYVRSFALIAIPAVATTTAIIFLRTATNGVQGSLYIGLRTPKTKSL